MMQRRNDGPEQSPGELLAGPPKRGAGVRRLNRLPLAIALSVISLFGIAFAYTLDQRSAGGAVQSEVPEMPEAASAENLLLDAPKAGAIEAEKAPEPEKVPLAMPAVFVQDDPTTPLSATIGDVQIAESPEIQKLREMRLQELQRRQQARIKAFESALGAETRVAVQRVADNTSYDRSQLTQAALQAAEDAYNSDPNRQFEKRTFEDQVRASQGREGRVIGRQPASSPYVVYEGTVIPAVLLTGINSDLPGELTGQVSENVYDTVSGKHVLIPQGARVVGTYDSRVSQGQRRVLVAWTRIIYPDGSSVDLGSMPGTDQAGASGFKDKVNNHYLRVFGNALLLSVFAAGIQLSQPEPRAGSGDLYTPQEQVAGSIGQQMGELGQEMARRNMNVQPTLEVRPGYTFNIMVTDDMELEPWR